MKLSLHANATTTPRVRAYIQSSEKSVASLARELNVSETTIRRWKSRKDVADRPAIPPQPRGTLTPEQESLVVELRRVFGLTLDELLEIARSQINAGASRSGLHRCLNRHGLARLRDLNPLVFEHMSRLWNEDSSGNRLIVKVELMNRHDDAGASQPPCLLAARLGDTGPVRVRVEEDLPSPDRLEHYLQALADEVAAGQVVTEIQMGPTLAARCNCARPGS
jgi:transposase-like protein